MGKRNDGGVGKRSGRVGSDGEEERYESFKIRASPCSLPT